MSEKAPQPIPDAEGTNPNDLMRQMDHAMQYGNQAKLEELFDSGIDINQTDFQGRTALMLSVASGKAATVDMLLTRGADVNRVYKFQDRIPMTALDAARQTGNNNLADILLGLGAKTGKEVAEEANQS